MQDNFVNLVIDNGKKSVVKLENRLLIIRQLVFIDLFLMET